MIHSLVARIVRFTLPIAVAVATIAAKADTFSYSYTFDNGTVVAGSFEGTANGNLVTNLKNISVSVNGIAVIRSLFSYSLRAPGGFQGGAQASFDGLQNNFFFSDVDYGASPGASDSPYSFLYSSFAVDTPWAAGVFYDVLSFSKTGPFTGGQTNVRSSWVLEAVSPTAAVPEPETYAMLLAGLGLLGLTARRRGRNLSA